MQPLSVSMYVDDFGTYRLPDHVRAGAVWTKSGAADRRYRKRNAAFYKWLASKRANVPQGPLAA